MNKTARMDFDGRDVAKFEPPNSSQLRRQFRLALDGEHRLGDRIIPSTNPHHDVVVVNGHQPCPPGPVNQNSHQRHTNRRALAYGRRWLSRFQACSIPRSASRLSSPEASSRNSAHFSRVRDLAGSLSIQILTLESDKVCDRWRE